MECSQPFYQHHRHRSRRRKTLKWLRGQSRMYLVGTYSSFLGDEPMPVDAVTHKINKLKNGNNMKNAKKRKQLFICFPLSLSRFFGFGFVCLRRCG